MLRPGMLLVLALAVPLASCGLYRRWRGDSHERPRPVAIDLNTASLRKIEALPGITPSMAKRIVEGRPYRDRNDLVEKGILTEREVGRIHDYVEVPDAD